MSRLLRGRIQDPERRPGSSNDRPSPVPIGALLGLAGLLHLTSIGSYAVAPETRCSCLAAEDLGAAVSSADAVFVGTAVASAVTADTIFSGDEIGAVVVVPARIVGFQVWSAWKGIMNPRIEVRTGTTAGDCGFPFEEGSTYLVFARADGQALSTSICSRTADLESALRDLIELGTPGYIADRG